VQRDGTRENMGVLWEYVVRVGRAVDYYTDRDSMFTLAPRPGESQEQQRIADRLTHGQPSGTEDLHRPLAESFELGSASAMSSTGSSPITTPFPTTASTTRSSARICRRE